MSWIEEMKNKQNEMLKVINIIIKENHKEDKVIFINLLISEIKNN